MPRLLDAYSIHEPVGAVWIAVLMVVLLAGCAPSGERSDGVRLVLTGDTIEPATTFELRFDEPAVEESKVGLPATESPLVIQPALSGNYVWLSQRSGVFTPTEPFKLGRSYRLYLRSGLKRLDGGPLSARLSRTVRTPDFGVTAFPPRGESSLTNASAQPTLHLQFNAEVDAAAVARFSEFRNPNGMSVPVDVRPAALQDGWGYFLASGADQAQTWSQRFSAARTHATDPATRLTRFASPAVEPSNPIIPGRVIITAAKPLPVGQGWRLVISAGLPAADDPPAWLKQPWVIPIGDVQPFGVREVAAVNGLNSGKRLRLVFSKRLSPELAASNLLEWISVWPVPDALTAAVMSAETIELAGQFQLAQRYVVELKAGLPAAESFRLVEPLRREVRFEPLPPRLYFPAFSTSQLSGGQRRFDLVTVNLSHVRLRAKQLDRHTLIHALRGYQSYYNEPRWNEGVEPYREVDFNVVPGRVFFQTNLSVMTAPDQAQRTALNWDDILGSSRQGAVFLVAEMAPDNPSARASRGTQALIQLTDLGLVWKSSRAHYWISVFSYRTGRPLAGVTVRLLTDDNEVLLEKITGPEGMAELPRPEKGAWLMAEQGDDLHALNLDRRGDYQLPTYGFGLPFAWNEESPESRKVLLFSDRSVYRPGEMLHLKCLVRDWQDNALVIPRSLTAKLAGYDARGLRFLQTNLTFTDLGSLAFSTRLPKSGGLGHYRMTLQMTNGEPFEHTFQVQEFEPAAFEIQIKSPAFLAAGERVELPVSAKYLMGKSLTKAKLRWSVEAEDVGFAPEGFEPFQFASQVGYYARLGREASSFATQGEADYEGATPFSLSPEIPLNPKAPQPRRVNLLVEMTDLNQQTISQSAQFTRHSSDFYLGLKSFAKVFRTGEAAPVELIAVRADGTPLTNQVKATVRLQQIEWRSVRVQGAGNTISYRNEPELEPVLEQEVLTCPVRRTGTAWEIANPMQPSLSWTPTAAGLYLIEAIAQDERGRDIITAVTFNVAGADQLAWNYRNEVQIDLVPDRTNYLAGQTAILLVKTPLSGSALVTVERDRVLRSFVTNLTGNAPALQIPLRETDAPNVFVSVMLLRGTVDSPHTVKEPEYRLGYCQLNVERPETRLIVELKSASGDYRPGQMVSLTAGIRDAAAQPVMDAEVTLYAVDEGILSLAGYRTPDPHAFFYAIHPLSITSYSTLPNLMPEDPEQFRFSNKGYLVGGGGQSADSLRKNFLPCAFWNATLRTDAAGKVRASFTAPDSLTRYRVIAVAQTAAHQFGHGETAFRLNKPLMVEPSLPRFANLGDQISARAVVHNQTDQPGDIEIALELDDKAAASQSAGASNAWPRVTRKLRLEARTSGSVEFPLEFVKAGTAQWIWRARFVGSPDDRSAAPWDLEPFAGRAVLPHRPNIRAERQLSPTGFMGSGADDFTDAVRSSLPVGYAAPLLKEVYVSRTTAATTNLLSGANPQLLEGEGTVTVRIANTRLTELGEAVSHLLHYPYGCVEQTSSSLLPWLVLQPFYEVMPQLRRDPAEVREVVQKGINRLLSMQTSSGGLAYWPGGSEPMLWGSAYGGLTLALAQRQGHAVPEAGVVRLFDYLGGNLRASASSEDQENLADRCLALYVLALAGRSEPSYHEQLFEKRHLLSAENRALLALAILEAKGSAQMAEALLDPKNIVSRSDDPWFGCVARELAMRLLAWSRFRSSDPQVDVLVEELVKSQKDAHWSTTQGNAWAIYALADYARRVENRLEPASGTLNWGDTKTAFQLRSTASIFVTNFPTARETANLPLRLENPQQWRLFVEVKLETRSRVSQPPRQDRGFLLQRSYALVKDNGSVIEFKQARVGDRVLVTLRLETDRPAHYVAVDDPLPAIFEAVNPDFKTQQTRAGEVLGRDWVSDYRELRTDRALFFRDHLPPGNYQLRYLARVRAVGTATAPAAKVEEMYHPERLGLTAATPVASTD